MRLFVHITKPCIAKYIRKVIFCKCKIYLFYVTCFLFTYIQISFSETDELSLKARFLEAAIRFITWPAQDQGHSDKDTVFTIGIFKKCRMNNYLNEVFAGKAIKDKSIKFKTIDSLPMITSCNLIFIPESQKENLPEILKATSGKPILTVSDFSDFSKSGLILCLTIENQKINCLVNQSVALKSGFQISYHLLQKSKIIGPHGN